MYYIYDVRKGTLEYNPSFGQYLLARNEEDLKRVTVKKHVVYRYSCQRFHVAFSESQDALQEYVKNHLPAEFKRKRPEGFTLASILPENSRRMLWGFVK